MGKEQQLVDSDLDDLLTLIDEFIDNKTPLASAQEVLQAIYVDETHLAALLEGYVNKTAIFQPLLEDDNLKNILIYLCRINPKIIIMPLNENGAADAHLLDVVCDDQDNYREIFNWLKENHPLLVQNMQDKMAKKVIEKKSIKEEVVRYVQTKNLEQFKKLLQGLSVDVIAEVIVEMN